MTQLSKLSASSVSSRQHVHSQAPLVLPGLGEASGRIENERSLDSLNKALGVELKRLQRNLGSDTCQLRERIYSATDISMIDRLFEKHRALDLSLLGEPSSKTIQEDKRKTEELLRGLASDRIGRLRRFNEAVESGDIDLKELEKLKRSGDAKAYRENVREIFDFIERRADLAFLRFARPHEDFLQTGVIRYHRSPAEGAPLTAAALREKPQKLSDTLAAVQRECQLLATHFPDQKTFLDILTAVGPQSIQYRMNDISESSYILARLPRLGGGVPSDPRLPLERKIQAAEGQIRSLSVDFLERSAAFREVMAHPEVRQRLLCDLTPQNRTAYERALQSGDRSEAAEKYHQATRRLISILNSSPEQIQRCVDVSPLETPVRPLSPPSLKSPPHSAGSDARREGRKTNPEEAVSPSRLHGQEPGNQWTQAPGIRGRLRAIAEARADSALGDLVQIALLSRIDLSHPHPEAAINQRLQNVVPQKMLQTHDLTGDVPAHQFAQSTNRRLIELTQTDSPLFQISQQRVEMERKKNDILNSRLGGTQLETALLDLRTKYSNSIGLIVRTHFPRLPIDEKQIQETLLPKSEIRRRSDLKAISDRAVVNQQMAASEPGRNLSLPIEQNPGERKLPSSPALLTPEARRVPLQLNTDNRQAIHGLQYTETSLIQIHGTVDGQALFVAYDPVRKAIVSDRKMAEDLGVRFIESTEKGPNGLPKISVQFTRPGEFSVDYRLMNLRTGAHWQGKVSERTNVGTNLSRLNETRARGENTWIDSIPSGAKAQDGSPMQYAFSKEEKRLYAKSKDGKYFFAFDAEKNCWHNVSLEDLPQALRRSSPSRD